MARESQSRTPPIWTEHHPRGYTENGEDATAEMDYVILDSAAYLTLPQPPLSCAYTERMSGKFLEKVLDVIGTGVGMPQFVNAEVMFKRALNLWAGPKERLSPIGESPSHLYRGLCGKLHPV